MLTFPTIEKHFPDFQVDTFENEDSIKIRLSTMVIDHPFYLIKNYYNKDEEFLKERIKELYQIMCKNIHHYYDGLSKYDIEKAKKLKVNWSKYHFNDFH